MRNELLEGSVRVDQQAHEFKEVELKIMADLMMQINQHADEPIFKKSYFQYDKYELPKIIGFDSFQLLLRPFKNNALFKKSFLWNKITHIGPILFLLLIPQFLFLRPDINKQLLLIWVISAIVFFILFFLALFYSQRVRNMAINQLQSYCINLSQQQIDVSISFIRQAKKGWKKCLIPYIEYFKIKSKTIPSDSKIVKLYTDQTDQAFNLFSQSQDNPIFTQQSYRYDKNRLQKIISFQELQFLFRPFKSNEFYKKSVFWGRVLAIQMTFIFVSLVPILFQKQGEQDVYLLVISLGCFFVFLVCFLLIVCKLNKLNLQLVNDFIQYCRTVSMQQQKIEVIVHLKQSNSGGQTKYIYCLQVKDKSI